MDYQQALDIAFRYLGYRARSVFEVQQKLREKGADQELESRVISRLKELNYLDDEQYAKSYLQERAKLSPRAFWLIKSELKKRGISQDIIEQAFSRIDIGEEQLAQAAYEQKKRIQKDPDKLRRFLASRGFSYDIIKKIIQ